MVIANDHVIGPRDYVPMTSIRTVISMVPCWLDATQV